MHRRIVRALLVVALTLVTMPLHLAAQRIDASRVGIAATAAPVYALPRLAAEPPKEKNLVLAGFLSYALPGAGSFYAGNDTHGWTHLSIQLAAIATVLVAQSSCKRSCPNEVGGAVLGITVAAVNDIWSIFTAVGDARAANRQLASPAPPAQP
jgi:hypothetical protein